jgi:hypothetical protein
VEDLRAERNALAACNAAKHSGNQEGVGPPGSPPRLSVRSPAMGVVPALVLKPLDGELFGWVFGDHGRVNFG